jgi:hypothetical protein
MWGIPASSKSGERKYEGWRSRYSFRRFLIRIWRALSEVAERSSWGTGWESSMCGILGDGFGRGCGDR